MAIHGTTNNQYHPPSLSSQLKDVLLELWVLAWNPCQGANAALWKARCRRHRPTAGAHAHPNSRHVRAPCCSQVRAKAMKALGRVVESVPGVLAMEEAQRCVRMALQDEGASVRWGWAPAGCGPCLP